MGTIRKLAAYVGEYKRRLLLAPVFNAINIAAETLIPYVTALIIDRGISTGDVGQVLLWGAVMLVLSGIALVVGALSGVFASEGAAGFAANLRDGLFERVQTFSFANIDHISTGGLVTRLTTDVTNIQNSLHMLVAVAVRAPLNIVSALTMCLLISPSLSTIFGVAMVVLLVAMLFLARRVLPAFSQMFVRYDRLNETVQENVHAIRVVKAFVREDHENEKFADAATALFNTASFAQNAMAVVNPIMMLTAYGCMVALSWMGTGQILGGELTTGQLTSLFGYVMNVLIGLMMLGMIVVMITMSSASAKRICEVLDEVPDIASPEDPVLEVEDGSVDFDHVWFSYTDGTGEEVLQDIDLHIAPGETIGIMGGTGSGKSTLVSLVSRLYDADRGTVRVGGKDVRTYGLEALRREVSVVLQNNVLFSGSVLDNLRWGREDATEEECREACRMACADEFVEAFPDGYETHIEQGGTNVSGGQRQRLCIARALLARPKVLILDDSTSAVDTATDARIQQAFREAIPGTTKLVISQRVASLASADRIVVMEAGRIVDVGTHEELLERCDIYADVWRAQTEDGGDFDRPQEHVGTVEGGE